MAPVAGYAAAPSLDERRACFAARLEMFLRAFICMGAGNMNELWDAARDNLSFLLVCVLVFAGLFVLAKLLERYCIKDRNRVSNARYISYVAMFAALAGVLMTLEIPLFFAPAFYKMDLSEVPVLICTFYLGPVAGVVTELLKVLVKLLIKGTSSAFVGDFANFVVGCAFVLPASVIYHLKKSKKSALWGMLTGMLTMTVFGSLFNAYYLLPKFAVLYGIPMDVIIGMGTAVNGSITSVATLVLYAVVPFNLVKGVLVSAVTFLLYKRVEKVIFRRQGADIAKKMKKSET
jgi:riboflavin transporter FmnP